MIDKILQNCGDYLIIDKKSNKKVRHRYYYEGHFEGYDRVLYFRLDIAQKGNVDNPDKRDEFGFLCDIPVEDRHIYFVWKNMERRCYYTNCTGYNNYGAKGIIVSDEFKTFSIFRNWYLENCYGEYDLELDKDCKSVVLNLPNKIYSKETCMLIPAEINTFLSTIGKGIYDTKCNTFCVRIRRNNERLNKNFNSIKDAKEFKLKKDLEYVSHLIEKYNISEEISYLLIEYVKISQ